MKLNVEIEIDDELFSTVGCELMQNCPEYSETLMCTSWKYDEPAYEFEDEDDDDHETFKVGEQEIAAGMKLMLEWRARGKLLQVPPPPVFSKSLSDWQDWLCQCDAGTCDTLIQIMTIGYVYFEDKGPGIEIRIDQHG